MKGYNSGRGPQRARPIVRPGAAEAVGDLARAGKAVAKPVAVAGVQAVGILARLARLVRRYPRPLGLLVIAVLLGSIALEMRHASVGCRSSDERARAWEAIRHRVDAASGEEIGDVLQSGFKCTDLASPRGVLVTAHEESGEAIIWFVDEHGVPHVVNLLASAWTPGLTPADIPENVLNRVR